MAWSGILGRTGGTRRGSGPVVFAVAGAGQASAAPGVCVSGPWGYASACINGPGWVDWNPGLNWGPPGQVKNAWCPGNPPVTGRVVHTASPVPNVT